MYHNNNSISGASVPRVLVFDDNPSIAARLERDVIDAGCVAKATADVSEILTLAEEFRPDVGVLDIKIDYGSVEPRDGIVAFAKLRSMFPFMEAIFVTAFSDVEEYMARARRFEAIVLPKPYKKEDLAESIRQKFAVSRDRRLDEWLRFAEVAESKGVDPDRVLDLISDIVASYNSVSTGATILDPEGVVAALAITDIVARNRDLVPELVRLFGVEVPDLALLLRQPSLKHARETARKYEEGAVGLARRLKEWEDGQC